MATRSEASSPAGARTSGREGGMGGGGIAPNPPGATAPPSNVQDRGLHQDRVAGEADAVAGELASQLAAVAPDAEHTALGVEGHPVTWDDAEDVHEHVRGGEGSVTAQVDLDRGREPAQIEVTVGARGDEGRLGERVLHGDALHERLV